MLKRLPALVTAFSALVLSASIGYDFGFLYWLGLSFAEVPTTFADHLRSSLIWIPGAILIFLLNMTIELFLRKIEQRHTEEEIIQGAKNPKRMALWGKSYIFPVCALVLLSLVLHLFLDIDIALLLGMFGLSITWNALHDFFFSHERVVERTSNNVYLFSRWFPVVLIYVVLFGAIAAENIPNGKKYTFELDEETNTYVIARSFEKYFMLWDVKKENIIFIPTSKVKRYYPVQKEKSNKSIQPTAKEFKR